VHEEKVTRRRFLEVAGVTVAGLGIASVAGAAPTVTVAATPTTPTARKTLITTSVKRPKAVVYNDIFTDGIIGPSLIPKMLSVPDGGRIVFMTTPGCWGPMITPKLKGGHEVNMPVAVDGACVGDAIVCKIRNIEVLSKASSSGTHEVVERTYEYDPFVYKKCPRCNTLWPEAVVKGIGLEAIICKKCFEEGYTVPCSPFRMKTGYTMVFDKKDELDLLLTKSGQRRLLQSGESGVLFRRTPYSSVCFLLQRLITLEL
jgi:hypothetical protein